MSTQPGFDPYRAEDAERGVYKGWLWLPPAVWQNDGAAPPTDATYGTNAQSVFDTKQFANATADDEVFTQFPVPPGMVSGNRFTLRVWFCINTNSGGVHWDGALNIIPLNGTTDAAGTALTGVTTTVPTTAYQMTYTDLDLNVSGEVIVPPAMCNIRLFRDISNAGDTAAAVAEFLGAELLWDKFAGA